MLMTCRGNSFGYGSRWGDDGILNLIIAEVSKVFLEDLLGMFGMIKNKFVSRIYKKLVAIWVWLAAMQPRTHDISFCEFHVCRDNMLFSKKDLIVSMDLIARWRAYFSQASAMKGKG